MEEGRKIVDTPADGDLEHGISSNWAYDHSVDLDAHIKSDYEILRTGNYHLLRPDYTTDSLAVTADRMYAVPLLVARDITIDRLAIEVTVADAGKIARLGIYENGTNLYPGALLLDASTLSVAGVTVVAVTVDQELTKGIYWLVLSSNGTPTVRCDRPAWSPLGIVATAFTTNYVYSHWYVDSAGSSGALPDPFPAGGTIWYSTAPQVLPRVSSLD